MAAEDLLVQLLTWAILLSVAVAIQAIIILTMVWILRKRQVWALIMFALRGGSLVLKGHLDNSVEFLFSRKPVTRVSWDVRDRSTNQRKVLTQEITQVFHRVKGTSYPLHLCPFDFPTNIDMNKKESSPVNNEEINCIAVQEYAQGYADAKMISRVGGFPMDKAMLLALFVVGALMIVMIAMQWQLGNMIAPK